MTIAKRLMLLLGLLLGALLLVSATAIVEMRSQAASVSWINVNMSPAWT